MLISIVIPVFNVSLNLLKRCLESIACQSSSDVEVIIVDDGSATENACSYRHLCQEYSMANYYEKENGGPSTARNFGVEKACGEYVFFVDADDYITNGCIEQARKAITQYHPDILLGYVHKDLADEGLIKYPQATSNPADVRINGEHDMAVLLNHILGYKNERFVFEHGYISDGPWCRFFKRQFFKSIFFDVIPQWNEDTLWNIDLLRACQTAVIFKSVWYIYAVRKGSVTQGYRNKCFAEFCYITEREWIAGDEKWKGMVDKGISYRVWNDFIFLSRAYIFNQMNKDSFIVKYNAIKRAIESKAYQRAVNIVDFKFERRTKYLMVKFFLNYAMRKRLYLVVYMIMKLYTGGNRVE